MSSRVSACLGLLAMSASCLHAGVQQEREAGTDTTPVFSGNAGFTIASQYITRGYIVQEEGTSLQPHLDLSAIFHQGDGFINSASLFLGLWGVVSSSAYRGGDESDRFTEFDYGPGITFSFAERWTFTSFYNRWTSPAGAYRDGHWINASIEFDDGGLLHENFSLKPFFQITHDFDFASSSGVCIEAGIRPSFTFFPKNDAPVSTSFLFMTGLGNGYYGEDYGYLALGPQVSVPLTFIDPAAGSWTLSAECLYHDFGSSLAGFNGRRDGFLLTIGLNVGF